MRPNTLRWTIRGQSALLALLVASVSTQAGYTPPSGSSSLGGELSTFLTNFGDWNAKNNNRPLLILEIAPESERGIAALWLFWMWLQNPQANGNLPPPPSSGGDGKQPSYGFTPGKPFTSPTGTIVLGQPEDGPSLPHNGVNLPQLGDDLGGSTISVGVPPQGGDSNSGQGLGSNPFSGSPPQLGDAPGSGMTQAGPSSQSGVPNNGQDPGSNPLPGIPPLNGDPAPPSDFVAVPEPARWTLLATAALGLLLYRGIRLAQCLASPQR